MDQLSWTCGCVGKASRDDETAAGKSEMPQAGKQEKGRGSSILRGLTHDGQLPIGGLVVVGQANRGMFADMEALGSRTGEEGAASDD